MVSVELYPSWMGSLVLALSCLESTRPAVPQDPLQRRLGWPSLQGGRVYGEAVLQDMAHVRSVILENAQPCVCVPPGTGTAILEVQHASNLYLQV